MVVYDCYIVDEILKFTLQQELKKEISERNVSFLVVSVVWILVWVINWHETTTILITTLCVYICLGYN